MIYDEDKLKCRTISEQINILFKMGKDLEAELNSLIEQINGGN